MSQSCNQLDWPKSPNGADKTILAYSFLAAIHYKKSSMKTRRLEYTDVLIDGEYIDELYDESRGIVGSSNQKIHFLTNFYNLNDFKNEVRVDIVLEKDSFRMNGWAINL